MAKRFIYNFRAAIGAEALESALVRFLKKKDIRYTEKDKVLGAVSAYWLPFAMLESQTCSEQQLKQYARDSIYNLQTRMNYIAQSFDLSEEILSVNLIRTKPSQEQAPRGLSEPEKTEDLEQITTSAETSTPRVAKDFLHNDDDGSFNGMFN